MGILQKLYTEWKLSRNQCRECRRPLPDDTPRGLNYCSGDCAEIAQALSF